jgi:spermidine/putrescine transport system substrate-binding protein
MSYRPKALALSLTIAGAAAAPGWSQDTNLRVMDWAGFDVPGLYADYEAKWGTKPDYEFVTSDDETFQKINSGYRADVLKGCSQMVPRLREADLIQPWDPALIPEIGNIDADFLNSPVIQDKDGIWMIPTDWGVTAVAYNAEKVPTQDVASLQVFTNPAYAGKTALPNASDDAWALAYLATGVTDWTNVTEAQFQAAADWLRAAHKNVRNYFDSSTQMAQMMTSGDILVAWSWPDGFNYLSKEGFPVGNQRNPIEGITTWFCGVVHLKNAPAGDERAYDYVNSWIRPEAAKVLVDEIGYGHVNIEGMKVFDPSFLDQIGLGPVTGPALPQLPISGAQRERQLSEFENIKAGF